MKRLSVFILALAIIFLAVPAAQAAVNYTVLKDEYIQNHPGQAIIPFPWEPITSVRVLPLNYEIPAAPGNTLSVTACRNEFEPTSFVINARKDLSGITITVPNLYDVQGNTIPSSALDVRLVKVWYQAAASNIYYNTPGYYLTPELLLKDDSLVKVDYVAKTNYLRVTLNGVQQYIDISSPTATIPQTAQVRDATTLQPFSLKANENKQVWITVRVPGTTPAGKYSGTITINAPSETPVTMNLSVTVLPFTLEPAPLEYALYYQGDLNPYFVGIEDSDKTTANMVLELQDLKDHGIVYPTLYWHTTEFLDQSLTLRDTVGFPKDKIYTLGNSANTEIGNPTDTAGLATVANLVLKIRNYTESHGYTSTYFYGIDEAMGAEVTAQRTAWQTVHNNGGKMYVAGDKDLIDLVPDLLDLVVLGGSPDTTQVARWHSYGKRIYSYGDPQAGIENPEIYRKNYGVTLWNAGYDGTMPFAYQHKYDDIWNDFDSQETHYRDHVFAYPTSNGVIDTIQWEGFREGVDDTRYVASLIKKDGGITSARSIVSAGLSSNENMTSIRNKVITQILLSPVPTPTPSPTPAPVLLTSQVVSTTIPTSMKTNTSSSVSLTMKNTGNTPWNEAGLIRLGGVGDGTGDAAKFGPARITIPAGTSVAPGAQHTFTFTMTPPATPGSYAPKYQMVWEGHQWFGDQASQYVQVTSSPAPTPTPAPTPVSASITVTAPDGGDSWIRGTTPAITWTSSGSVGSYVKIELLKAGVLSQTIATSTPNDGSFTGWTIPSTSATGTDYRVRITSTTNAAIMDSSNNYFAITTAPSVTVTSPNGGENWKRGTTHTIAWNFSGSPGSQVKIVLLKAGTVVDTINAGTPIGSNGKGTYAWSVPMINITGDDFTISIQSVSQPTIRDTSNRYFRITTGGRLVNDVDKRAMKQELNHQNLSVAGGDSNPHTKSDG